jgi:MYXO-CTERM domain-containing protein
MKSDRHRSQSQLSYTRGAVMLAALLQASWAAADVAPRDACNLEGAACEIAGSGGSSVGLCTRSRCTRYYPEYPDGGGGAGPIYVPHEFDCLRCIVGSPADAGTADAGSTGNAEDEGCGCGLPGTGGEAPLAALMLGLGLLALRAGRRRRRPDT